MSTDICGNISITASLENVKRAFQDYSQDTPLCKSLQSLDEEKREVFLQALNKVNKDKISIILKALNAVGDEAKITNVLQALAEIDAKKVANAQKEAEKAGAGAKEEAEKAKETQQEKITNILQALANIDDASKMNAVVQAFGNLAKAKIKKTLQALADINDTAKITKVLQGLSAVEDQEVRKQAVQNAAALPDKVLKGLFQNMGNLPCNENNGQAS